ncbi:DUF4194 domain-containing protein [Pseudomonas silvicola]|nr:DUF4194 domain-containing protein [Pseudomonas silvicola]
MSQQEKTPQGSSLFDRFRPAVVEDRTTPEAEDESAPAQEGQSPADGEMPLDARRAMVLLLRQGVIMASQKRLAFDALCLHEPAITRHLASMFLHLILDRRAGIAILLQQDDDTDDTDTDEQYSMVNKRTLTLYDTVLLLVLRKYYQERETAGEQRIIIATEQIEALMTPFLPLTQSTRGERRTLSGATRFLLDKRLISNVRGDFDRFEVTPVIRYVVNADFLDRLLAEYQRLTGPDDAAPPKENNDE